MLLQNMLNINRRHTLREFTQICDLHGDVMNLSNHKYQRHCLFNMYIPSGLQNFADVLIQRILYREY